MRSRPKRRKVDGLIVKTRTRTTTTGKHAHIYTIGKLDYSQFNDHPSPLLEVGEHVSFEAETRQTRTRSRTTYHVIIDDTLVLHNTPATLADIGGHVYVLTNASMPGLCKIGFTTGLPAERAAELSGSTGVPTPFTVAWSSPVRGDPKLVERVVHGRLSRQRHGKEFFTISPEHARKTVETACKALFPETRTVDSAATLRDRKQKLSQQIAETQAREAYERSPQAKFASNGYLDVLEHEFTVPVIHWGSPSFLDRLFGNVPPNWMSYTIAGVRGTPPVRDGSWSVRYRGLIDRKYSDATARFSSYHEARQFVDTHLRLTEVRNYRIQTEIPSDQLIDPKRIDLAEARQSYRGVRVAMTTDSIYPLIKRT